MRINPASPAYVIGFAALTSAVFTAGIMTLHVATADIVERNQRLLRQRALVELFGLGNVDQMTDEQIARTVTNRIDETRRITDPGTDSTYVLIRAFDRDKADPAAVLVGYGLPISGVGFWARIDGLLALTPDLREISGVSFLAHSETPGLGGRITERRWREQFKRLKATPPGEGRRYIYVGGEAPASPTDPRYSRHIDAITGATQTSIAVADFIDEDLRRFRRAARAAGLTTLPAGD